MTAILPTDLLRPEDWVAVTAAQLAELVQLAEAKGLRMPDHADVEAIHYNERLTDEGIRHEFYWSGTASSPWKSRQRLEFAVFRRRMVNTLPMMAEADAKRRELYYKRLIQRRVKEAMTCIRRHRREPYNSDHLKDALRLLGGLEKF